MGRSKAAEVREVLSGKVGTRGKDPMRWFDGHPEAKEFVVEWLKMRNTGESMWSAQDVLDHLHSEYGYPFATVGGFTGFLRRTWPELYCGKTA